MDPNTLLNKDNQAIVYYILYSEIELNNITIIALKLVNRVYSYAVTTINTIINAFPININPFTYNITLYYTFINFIDKIIDTKAFKYFLIGYSQFLYFRKLIKYS